jgi:2-keto-3-deoxy-L-rhamnonate aldolase RhmA
MTAGERIVTAILIETTEALDILADSLVALGGLANSPEEAKQMVGRGYQFILLGFDVGILSAHLGSRLGEITGDPQ